VDVNGNSYGFAALDALEWPGVVARSQDPSLRSS
jgi:hypothetical protein